MAHDLFLPTPRIPISQEIRKFPEPDWLDGLAPGAGDPIRTYRQQSAEVRQAVAEVEAARPGGDAWKDAQAKDAAAVMEGKAPKTWAVGSLLAGDPQRWARASALARTITRRVIDVPQELAGNEALVAAAQALLAEERTTLARSARDAWVLAKSGKSEHRAGAWKGLAAAKAAHDEAGRLLGLLKWLDGSEGNWDPIGWRSHCWTPEVAGEFLAASIVLGDQGNYMTLPKGVTWPHGFDPSTGVHYSENTAALAIKAASEPARVRG